MKISDCERNYFLTHAIVTVEKSQNDNKCDWHCDQSHLSLEMPIGNEHHEEPVEKPTDQDLYVHRKAHSFVADLES